MQPAGLDGPSGGAVSVEPSSISSTRYRPGPIDINVLSSVSISLRQLAQSLNVGIMISPVGDSMLVRRRPGNFRRTGSLCLFRFAYEDSKRSLSRYGILFGHNRPEKNGKPGYLLDLVGIFPGKDR